MPDAPPETWTEAPADGRPPPPAGSYPRGGPGLEFSRVSIFSDAVYAIALTLLVVALDVPQAPEDDPAALASALWATRPNIVGFFVGFVLLGHFWLAHHQFFASLRSVDRPLIVLNLVYLAFVAFMPFPVALISEFERNPVAFYVFAGCMATISLLELVMFAYATRHGHTRAPMSPEAIRFGLVSTGAPVAVMLLSLPLAAIHTTWALILWLVLVPLGLWLRRRGPRYPSPARRIDRRGGAS